MNWKDFIIGVGFLAVAYFIFRSLKGGPSSEKNNWVGPTGRTYVQGWSALIICVLIGIVLIIKALPAHIE